MNARLGPVLKQASEVACCDTCGAHFQPSSLSPLHCETCVRGHLVVSGHQLAGLALDTTQPLPLGQLRAIAESVAQLLRGPTAIQQRPRPAASTSGLK